MLRTTTRVVTQIDDVEEVIIGDIEVPKEEFPQRRISVRAGNNVFYTLVLRADFGLFLELKNSSEE